MKPVAGYMEDAGIGDADLVKATGLDRRVIRAIVTGNYTPSPLQRKLVAEALGVAIDEIAWDHSVSVQHLRGNGPQCGRST